MKKTYYENTAQDQEERLASELNPLFFFIISLILIMPLQAFAQPYSPLSLDGTWTTASSIGFTPRESLSSSVIEGKIYVTGGAGTNGFLNTLEVFDPATNTWNTPVTAGMFAAHFAHTSSAVNGKIYVFGGAEDTFVYDSTVAVFDPSTNTWSTLYEISGTFTPRFDLTSCVLDGKIFVIGGETGEFAPYTVMNTIEVFDPLRLSWDTLPPMAVDTLIPVLTPTSHVINSKIYVIGKPMDTTSTNIVQVYDPLTNKWTTPHVTGAAILRAYFTSSEVNGKIYVLGGQNFAQNSQTVFTNALEVFDPSTNAWSIPVTTGTLTARAQLTSSVVDGKIYAMGGGGVAGSRGYDNKNEVFTPAASGVKSMDTLSDIKLFPNPTDGIISVQNAPSNTKQAAIINMLGETVMEITNLHTSDFTMDLSKLPSGIYCARFTTSNSVMIKKIVRY